MSDDLVRLIDRRIEYQGFFRLETLHLEHRRHAGGWSEVLRREVFVLPFAAAVLPYDPVADRVVLIEQFRAGTYAAGAGPWLVEVVAGFVDKDETPEQAARREAREEAALDLAAARDDRRVLPQPGRQFRDHPPVPRLLHRADEQTIQGCAAEHEDIRVFTLPAEEAFARVANAQPAKRDGTDRAAVADAEPGPACGPPRMPVADGPVPGPRRLAAPVSRGYLRGRNVSKSERWSLPQICDGFVGAVGNTAPDPPQPPVRRDRLRDPRQGGVPQPRRVGQGPGGVAIIRDAERRGTLRPGRRRGRGHRRATPAFQWGGGGGPPRPGGSARPWATASVIVMPETQSQEKKDMLRLCGADLRLVKAVPYKDPGNYVRFSERLASELGETRNTALSGPTSSTTSPIGRDTTRPRARRSGGQTDGKVDAFTCAVAHRRDHRRRRHGAQGTQSEGPHPPQRPDGIGALQPLCHGELKAEGSSITEGIGQGRITRNLEGAPIEGGRGPAGYGSGGAGDDLSPAQRRKGLVMGGSTGINVCGAVADRSGAGARPHHRHHPVRPGHPLPVEDLQSAFLREKGPADAAVARGVSRTMTDLLFRDDAYLTTCEATVTAVDDRGLRLEPDRLLSHRRRAARRQRAAGAGGRPRGRDRRHGQGRRAGRGDLTVPGRRDGTAVPRPTGGGGG